MDSERQRCLPRSFADKQFEMVAEKEGKPGYRSGSPGLQDCPCLPTLNSLQTDKEQLTAEAKELRQKVRYLQDQLSPLTRQREYQEKEIQRLNKVGTRTPGRGWLL